MTSTNGDDGRERVLLYDWNQASGSPAPPGPVELNDETLRDGLQSPSAVHPPVEKKIEILHHMEALGIDVRLSTEVREFFGHGELEAVALSDGTEVRAGLALVAKGVQPNTSCVRGTGVVIGLGIEVDRYLATGAPEVYAAGDVAEAYDPLRGKPWLNALWPMAVEQGRTAALNMTGSRVCYGGSIRMNAVEIFGYPCVSIGHVYDLDGTPSFVRHDRRAQSYRKLFVQGDRLVGAVLMGDVRGAGILAERIRFPRPSSAGWLDETLVFGPRFGRHLDADREAA